MSILKKGTPFGATEQVTSDKLNNLVDNASFTDTSANPVAYNGSTGTCLNGGGLEVTSAGQLQIKDADVSTAKLADDAVTPAKTSFIDANGVMTLSGGDPKLIFIDTENETTDYGFIQSFIAGHLVLKTTKASSDITVSAKDALIVKNDETERFRVNATAAKDESGSATAGAKVTGGLYVTGDVYADDQVVADHLLLQGDDPTITFADDNSSGKQNPLITGNSTNGNLAIITKESESELILECSDNMIFGTTDDPTQDQSGTNDFVERFRVSHNAGKNENGSAVAGAKVTGGLYVTGDIYADDHVVADNFLVQGSSPKITFNDDGNSGTDPYIIADNSGSIGVYSTRTNSDVIIDGNDEVRIRYDGTEGFKVAADAGKDSSGTDSAGAKVSGDLQVTGDINCAGGFNDIRLKSSSPKIVFNETDVSVGDPHIQSFNSGNLEIKTEEANSLIRLDGKKGLIVEYDGSNTLMEANATAATDASGNSNQSGVKVTGDLESTGDMYSRGTIKATTAIKIGNDDILDLIHPVGSVISTTTNYADSAAVVADYGGTTWTRFSEGQFPVGYSTTDSDFSAGNTGGAKDVTLTLSQIPAHDHVPNRNTYGTANILLNRRADGGGSTGGTDNTVGEAQVNGGYGLPEVEGGGGSHENLPPYKVVYMWTRTA
jgi:microcystin-dependent protein